ncbi:acyl-CoA dehydratase activase [Candidatus Hodarchaeum mangrovi]
MSTVAGLDIGSLTAKIVVLKYENSHLIKKFSQLQKVGYNPSKIAQKLKKESLNALKLKNFDYIVSTGYGRRLIDADKTVTEITCHAKGAHYINPKVRTIIDIGGQDSKVIRINEVGQVQNFEMNDKCSAGTGRFLEVMANALEVDITEFGTHALESTNPVAISSTCTVFAESEVIGRINQGVNRNDVIAGIHSSIASKISMLAARVGVQPEVILTGGVALNPGVRIMLERNLEIPILLPENPQIIGALGAALIAAQNIEKT